jgi:hypothetical protein
LRSFARGLSLLRRTKTATTPSSKTHNSIPIRKIAGAFIISPLPACKPSFNKADDLEVLKRAMHALFPDESRGEAVSRDVPDL